MTTARNRWLSRLTAKKQKTHRTNKRRDFIRPLFEQLEDRRVLAALTWDGGGSNNNWSTAENWVGDTAPVAGDDLIFDTSVVGLARFTATNDSAGFAVNSIQVLDGSVTNNFTLNGQGITLAAGLTAGGSASGSLANTTIGFNSILLAGPQEFELSSGDLSVSSSIDTGGHAFAFTGDSSNGATISGVISGSGSVTKTGTTILSLNAPNTYTGQTFVSGGSVNVRQANSLGATSGGTVVDGGSLVLFDNLSIAEPLSLAGTGSFGNGALLGGNNSVVSGSVTLTNSTLVKAINANSHFRITGAISDGGAGFGIDISFTQAGQTLTLGGANTYSGSTDIQNAGTLLLGAAGAIPAASTVTLSASTSVLDLNDVSVTIGSLSGPGSVDLGAGTLTIGANNGHSTFSGTVSGTGGLVKLGSGTFTLSGANTYSGATVVQSGVLQIESAMALGAATAGTTIASGATLAVTPPSFTSFVEPLTLNGNGHGLLGALRSEKAAGWNGPISLGSETTVIQADQAFGIGGEISNNGFNLNYSQSAASTHSGNISGVISGSGGLNKSGQQQLNLSGSNTYSGLTTVLGGILSVSGDGRLGDLSAGTVVVDGASLSVGATNAPFTEPLSLEGTGAPQYNGGALHGANSTNVAGPITLTGDARIAVYNSNSTMTISGPIGDGGNGFGITVNAFSESGRTLHLTGVSNYSGPTHVNSGRLLVDGELANTSQVVISSGAILTGSGSVGEIIANSGATVRPAFSLGSMTSGSLNLSPSSTFVVELDGTTPGTEYDQVIVTGTVNLGGATLQAARGFSPLPADSFKIIDNDDSDSVIGTFAGLVEGATLAIDSQNFSISYVGGDGNDVVLTPVPSIIEGIKFHDLNADGNQDAGEPGLAGWTIYADLNDSGSFDSGEPNTVTGADGSYQLIDVPAGVYSIYEVPQNNWLSSRPAPVNGTLVEPNPPILPRTGVATTTVSTDITTNTTWDVAGAPYLVTVPIDIRPSVTLTIDPGVEVLFASGAQLVAVGQLNAIGTATQPILFTSAAATPARNDWHGIHVFNTSGAQANFAFATIEYANTAIAINSVVTIADSVIRHNSTGLSGVPSTRSEIDRSVFDDNNRGMSGGARNVRDSLISNGDYGIFQGIQMNVSGSVIRDNLTGFHGAYDLAVRNSLITGNTVGVEPYFNAGPQLRNNEISFNDTGAILGGGNNSPTVVVGNSFHDNTVLNLQTRGANDKTAASNYWGTTANAAINATIEDARDNINLGLVLYEPILTAAPNAAEQRAGGLPVTVPSGGTVSNVDFGNYQLGTISGVKFDDLNGDGVKDSGEPGLEGWTIYLDANDNSQLDNHELRTRSGTNGSYSFSNLLPGEYQLREVSRSGWQQTLPSISSPLDPIVVWANDTSKKIVSSQLDGTNLHDITSHAGFSTDVAVDPEGGKVYWSTSQLNNSLQRSNLDGSDVEVLYTGTVVGSFGLDTVNDTIYFVTPESGLAREIRRMNLDGTNQQTLFTPNPGEFFIVSDIAVDPAGGKLYWINTNGAESIQRSNLDGSNIETIVSDTNNLPQRIALDVESSHVYWSGHDSTKSIMRSNLDGSDIAVLVSDGQIPKGFDVDPIGDKLYWIDNISPVTLRRANLDGTSIETIISDLESNALLGLDVAYPITTSSAYDVTTISGQAASNYDFGNHETDRPAPVEIHGVKFNDLNANGTKDAGEPGLPGWTIFLDANANRQKDSGEPSTVTSADGSYSFTNLAAGTYIVGELQQASWQQSLPELETPAPPVAPATTTIDHSSITPTTTASGGIFEDTTWDLTQSPVRVTGTVSIFPSATLTIEPGVVVLFDSGTRLDVRGKLLVQGTAAGPVLLTSSSATPAKNDWSGISVNNSVGGSAELSFATVEFASSGISISNNNSLAMEISDSTFRQNTTAISHSSVSRYNVARSLFDSNTTALRAGDMNIYDSIFSNNTTGLAETFRMTIENSLFTGNDTAVRGYSDTTIRRSVISGNTVGVQEAVQFGAARVESSTITENDIGFQTSHTRNLSFSGNNIFANTTANVVVQTNKDHNFAGNYWGTQSALEIATSIHDSADDPAVGTVTVDPYSLQELDTTPPAAGFHSVTLGSGAIANDIDFGNYQKLSVSFVSATALVDEDAGVVTIEAQLASALPFDTSVPVTFSGTATLNADYLVSDPNLYFPAGSTTGVMTIVINDDLRFESVNTVIMTMELGVGVAPGATPVQTLSINDNDPVPGLSFFTAGSTADESVGSVLIEARLTAESEVDVEVPLLFSGTATEGSDYSAGASPVITIPAGALRGSLTVNITNDLTGEPAERIVLNFGTPTGAVLSTNVGDPLTHVITIPQNDEPNVSFTASQGSFAEDGGTRDIIVRLSNVATTDVVVPFTISHGTDSDSSDYSVSPAGSLTIAAGQTVGVITLTGQNDNIDESNERITVRMGTPTGAVPGTIRAFTGTIIDDDTSILQFTSSGTTAWENEGAQNVTLRLYPPSATDVTVSLYTTGVRSTGSLRDFDLSDTSVTFLAGQTSKTITVNPYGDSRNEKTEYGYVRIGDPDGVKIGKTSDFRLKILDDDPYVYLIGGTSIRERNSTSTTITVRLTAKSNRTVTVPLAYSGSARRNKDFTGASSVTFSPGQTSKTFTITAKNDSIDEYTETILVRIKNPTNARTTIRRTTSKKIRILDNDSQPVVSFKTTYFERREGQGAWIEVKLSRASGKTIKVPIKISRYSTATNSDHNFRNKTLTFKPGQTIKSFQIRITNDNRSENRERLRLYISNRTTNATRNIWSRSASVYIVPSDACRIVSLNTRQAQTPTGTLAIDPSIQFKTIGDCRGGLGGVGFVNVSSISADDLIFNGKLAVNGGYVVGGTAFFDANFNGIVDFLDLNNNGVQDEGEPSEPVTTTTQDGSFSLGIDAVFDVDGNETIDLNEGRFVLTGGVDGATQLPFVGQFSSVPGQLLLSSVSSTIQHLTQLGFDIPGASERLVEAMGMPEGVELETLDLFEATMDGNADAAVAYARSAELFNATVVAAGLFSGAPGAPPKNLLVDLAYAEIASRIQDADSEIDLANAATVGSLLEGIAFRTGITFPTDVIDGAASLIARGNLKIRDLPVATDAAFVEQIVRVETWMQGDLASDVQAVSSGSTDIATVLASYAGSALDTAVANTTIGDIEVPVIFVNDVVKTEGDDGTTAFDFTVTLTSPSKFPVSVAYQTNDDSAVAADGDFTAIGGTLNWAPGESGEKTVSVMVNGDEDAEADEQFLLNLFDAENSIVRREVGAGFIINDDAVDYKATHLEDETENLFILELSDEDVILVEDDEEVFSGFQAAPWQATLQGEDDIDDTLFLDFSAGTYRSDTITFDGGGGTGFDSAVISGGEFDNVTVSLTNATDGQTVFDPADSDEVVTLNWMGLEPFTFNSVVADMLFELPAGVTSAVLEDIDPTDEVNPGVMRLFSPDGHFEEQIFPVPTNSLTIRGGNGADTISIASLDPAFAANLIIDGDFSGSDPVAVSVEGTIDVPPLLHVQSTSFDVNAAITDTLAVGELRVDATTATLNADVVVENVVIAGGTLVVGASLLGTDLTVQDGGTLAGNGTVSGSVSVESGGHIAPGPGIGKLTVGSLTLASGAQVDIDINGVNAGEFDQIADPEFGLNLAGATLNVSLGTTPVAGNEFPIIVNSVESVTPGVFAGLPNGTSFVVDSTIFEITYPQVDGVEVLLRVLNTTPVSNPGGPYSATEGVALDLDGSGSADQEDANAALSFDWDLDYDGSTFDVDATGEQPSVVFGDNAVGQVIGLRVTDSDGASHIVTTTVNVANENPSLATNDAGVAASVGSQAVNTGTYGDVPADTVTLTASVGEVFALNGQWVWLLDVENSTPASQTVTITAIDEDGGETESTFELVAFSVPPLITSLSGDTTGDEGDLLAYQVEVLNLTGATLTYLWDFGDGSAPVTGNDLVSVEHQFNGNGVFPVTVMVFDDPEDTGTVRVLNVTVDNALPTVTSDEETVTVTESAIANNTGTFGDLGDGAVAITASRGTITQDNDAGTWSWSLATADGPDDSETITITATDSDNAVKTATFELTVNNAPPTVARSLAAVTVIEGATATNTGTFGDVGDDVVTITASRGTITQNDAAGTWSWSLTTTDGPDDSGTITITATDSDNAVATTTFDLTTNNSPPTVASNLATVTVIEGASATNTGTFGDVGDDVVTITASRGTITQNDAAGTWSWSLATTDGPDDSGTITITATDSDNAVTTTTFGLTVNNAPPSVASNLATVTVIEGASATNSGTFGDVGDDAVTISASLGTITQNDVTGTWSWSLATTDGPDDSGTITITATDSDNAVTTTTFGLTVNNAAPIVAATNASVSVNEGATATNSGTFADVGNDTVTITASSGLITQNNTNGTWSWSLATTDGPDDSGTITITATDSDNAVTTTTFGLTVNNSPPSVVSNLATVTVIEGASATNTGTFDDVGDDAVTISASRGTITQNNAAGTWSWSLATTDGPDDSGTITITATDSDNAVTTTTFDLTVNNAAPIVAATNASVSVNEGATATNSGTFADIGNDTVTITASSGLITQDNTNGTWSWSLDTTDGPDDSQTVTITATDSDNAVTTTTFGLTVNNAAPTVASNLATVTVIEGAAATNAGTFADVGNDTVTITASSGSISQSNTNGSWSWSLDTTDGPDDSRTVTITATDSDNAVTTTTFDLTVNNAAPTVTRNLATVTVIEGATATNTGAFADVGNDTVTITASRGTITQDNAAGTWSWSLATTNGPDDSGTIIVTATDSDDVETTTTFDLDVDNVAPSVAADNVNVTVGEGATATNTGTFFDAGADDVMLSASIGAIVDSGGGTWSWSFTTNDGPDDTQTVTVTATDSDGAATSTTFDLTVDNLPPTVTVDNTAVTISSTAASSNTGTFADPGNDNVALVASVGTITDDGGGNWSWSIASSAGLSDGQTVTITATDSDGVTSMADFTLHVNLAPTIIDLNSSNPDVADASSDSNISIDGVFTDLDGADDTHVVTVDWGDGGAVETLPVGSVDQANDSFLHTHSYASGGVYVVTVTVVDGGGLSSPAELTTAVVAGSGVHNRTLEIIGTASADIISVKPKGKSQLQVSHRFRNKETFDLSSFDRIFISTGDGNDLVKGSRRVDVPMIIFGGGGDDFIEGGSQTNLIVGGLGNDTLTGGEQRDVMVGGEGSDLLTGKAGDDVLVPDAASNSHTELLQIWDAWNAPGTFAERSDVVRSLFVLADDAAEDFTIGGDGDDLVLTPALSEGEDRSFAVVGNESPPTSDEFAEFQPGLLDNNPLNTNDVNGDGFVSPVDVLQVVNDLIRSGSRSLDWDPTADGCDLNASDVAWDENHPCINASSSYFPDTNSDGSVSPIDALQVINELNERRGVVLGEGETLLQAEVIRTLPLAIGAKHTRSAIRVANNRFSRQDPNVYRMEELDATNELTGPHATASREAALENWNADDLHAALLDLEDFMDDAEKAGTLYDIR